ncbi:hypothetical protein [Caulobacter mirabilis]|uniref:Uncharacterized protein n=1 Tax=Caulobacter mirabilis TaxID=69666 RepID=A0A2D2ASM6_9CAUL|nr:hypothetical protein [Caulobacter mirabilis]ATQ41018.1 hypothetical protein CSW64_00655 [Caulobacter mirabilis]
MRSRRALAGLLAVGATILVAGSADALSWSRPSCEEFRRSLLDGDAFVRARVSKTWDLKVEEEQRSSKVEAAVREAILGQYPRGARVAFTAREVEFSGVQFGFIPAEGDEIMLVLDQRSGRRWTVNSTMTAAEYEQYWVPRCGF